MPKRAVIQEKISILRDKIISRKSATQLLKEGASLVIEQGDCFAGEVLSSYHLVYLREKDAKKLLPLLSSGGLYNYFRDAGENEGYKVLSTNLGHEPISRLFAEHCV